ncbi:MAG TPA: GAF domain-containing protein [Cyanobacteria bacterium UBA8803]|nr:GAF domain-containing protein [Cyanobacteria bacterium UBA9273]HBL58810.1 GAF domain-containing protein [Cyanobacteria bacterium UBA8803]
MSKTLSVHPKYIQEVQLAWMHKSNGQQGDLTAQLGRSLSIVINNLFLKGQPVNQTNFLEICQILGLDWREVAGLDGQDNRVSSEPKRENRINTNGCAVAIVPTLERSLTVDQALNQLVSTLCEMLGQITRKAGNLLSADRTSIFLIDRDKKEVGSLIAEDGCGGSLLIDIPMNKGIVGLAATTSKVVNIPFDVYDDPRSEQAKKTDSKTGYRTYTILAWPLLNKQKEVVAVVQFINKLKPDSNPKESLSQRIDKNGFTPEDEVIFGKFAPSILGILGKCQICHQLAQKLTAGEQITQAGVVLQEDELVEELIRREQQLQMSLDKLF